MSTAILACFMLLYYICSWFVSSFLLILSTLPHSQMTYDLVMECDAITNGKECPELLGSLRKKSDFHDKHFRRDSYNTDDQEDPEILLNGQE